MAISNGNKRMGGGGGGPRVKTKHLESEQNSRLWWGTPQGEAGLKMWHRSQICLCPLRWKEDENRKRVKWQHPAERTPSSQPHWNVWMYGHPDPMCDERRLRRNILGLSPCRRRPVRTALGSTLWQSPTLEHLCRAVNTRLWPEPCTDWTPGSSQSAPGCLGRLHTNTQPNTLSFTVGLTVS